MWLEVAINLVGLEPRSHPRPLSVTIKAREDHAGNRAD